MDTDCERRIVGIANNRSKLDAYLRNIGPYGLIDLIEFGADLVEMSGKQYSYGLSCLDNIGLMLNSTDKKRQQIRDRFEFNREQYYREMAKASNMALDQTNLVKEYFDEPTMNNIEARICKSSISKSQKDKIWR